MIYWKLFFIFLLIFSFSKVKLSLAYQTEEIIGGYPAFQPNHRYHAAIVGKYENNNIPHLLCSAVIITNYLLLSAARCFLFIQNKLKKQIFRAVVGKEILKPFDFLEREIERIYTYAYNSISQENNIAVVKLKDYLDVDNTLELSIAKIPFPNEKFEETSGTVSGFGMDTIDTIHHRHRQKRIQFDRDTGQVLKYAFVKLSTNDTECKQSFEKFNNMTSVCGTIKPDSKFSHRGLCIGDIGAPLVFDDKVVGIASIHRPDCDDTKYGTIYTKVAFYKDFIDAIIMGSHLDDTIIHYTI